MKSIKQFFLKRKFSKKMTSLEKKLLRLRRTLLYLKEVVRVNDGRYLWHFEAEKLYESAVRIEILKFDIQETSRELLSTKRKLNLITK
jgi:hypothetical protein